MYDFFIFAGVAALLYFLWGMISPEKALFFIQDAGKRSRLKVALIFLPTFFICSVIGNNSPEKRKEREKEEEKEKAEIAEQTPLTKEWKEIKYKEARVDSVSLHNYSLRQSFIDSMSIGTLGFIVADLERNINPQYPDSLSDFYEKDPKMAYKMAYSKKRAKELFEKFGPSFRKRYATVIGENLWDKDIDVSVSGSKKDILWFTGAAFAARKNIKEMQESVSPVLHTLKFKRVCYKWTEYDDDYTYYDIK